MSALVSILIPAYNAERWLAETLSSALAQTWPTKEIIVVDDGSKDATVSVARSFTRRGVVVYTQENRGAAVARNRALSLSHGDFIQWLDADDLLAPEKIQTQISRSDPPGDLTLHSCGFGIFFRRADRFREVRNALCCELSARDWLRLALGTGEWLPPHTWLASRQLLNRAGPWDERLTLNDDGEYFARVVSHAARVQHSPGPLSLYRTGNASSLSRRRSPRTLESLVRSVELSVDHLLRLSDEAADRRAAFAFLQYNVDRFELVEPEHWNRLAQRAKTLGGELRPPARSWQYRLTSAVLGQQPAKHLKAGSGRVRWAIMRARERLGSPASAVRKVQGDGHLAP